MTAIKWKSGVSGDWNTGSDWSGGVPGASNAVTIAAAGTYAVTVDHSEAAQSILLNAAGASLVESGQHVTLTLGTGLTVSAGTLSLIASLYSPQLGFGSTQLIEGGFLNVSKSGVLSMTLPAGAGSAEYSTQVASSVDLEGTTNIGTQTVLYLTGGGVLGGTIAGSGEAYLTGSYLANGASFSGLSTLALDAGGFFVTTGSGSFTNLLAQDSSTLSVASGLTATVSGNLEIGTNSLVRPEASFANVISGPGTLITTSKTEIDDNSNHADELTLGGGLTWVNSGELNILGAVAVNQAQGDSFTLVNQASGTVLFEQPGAFVLAHPGTDLFTNAGALDSSGNVTLAIPLVSTGLIDPVGSLTLTGGGTLGGGLDDSGTLVLTGNYTLAPFGLAGGVAGLGNGHLALEDGVLAVGTSSTFAGGFGTDGGNDEIVLTAGADFTLSGAATIGQTAAESPNLYIIGPGTLTTLGATTLDDAGSGVSLIGNGTWINGGAVTDNAVISLGDTTTASDVETIVNQAGATFSVVGPDGGILINGAGTGVFDNAGMLVRGNDSGTSTIAAYVSSSGTIDVASGTLALTGGGMISGELDGSGTLLLSAGHFTIGSHLSGNGHYVVGAGATVTTTTVLDGNLTQTIASGQTVSFPGLVAIGDASGGYTFNGPGTLSTQGTTSIFDGGAGVQELGLGGAVVWANGGTVNDGGVSNSTGGTVVNSGTFNFISDDATITNNGAPNLFTNSGTLAKTGGTGASYIGDVVRSTGSIDVATGALQFIDGGSVSGTLSGAGTLHLATGIYTTTGLAGAGNLAIDNARELGYGTLTASATSTITASVHIDGGGALGANAGKILTLTGPLSIDTVESAPSVDGGNLVGAGTVTTTGATTIGDVANGAQALGIAGGITWINAATGVVNDSGLGNSVGGTVVNNGIFNLATDDATITNNGAPNLFTNSGTLAKTGGTGTSYIGDVVNSTGSINVATGALQFIDGGSVSGTLFGAGTLHLATGIYTTTGLAGAGNLAIDNARELGYGTLTASATSTITASVHIDGGGALGANAGKILTLTGPLSIDTVESAPSVDGGNLVGAGTVTTTGATTIGDVANGAQALGIAGGITWINAATGVVNDSGLGNSVGGTVVNNGIFNLATDDATITNNGAPNLFTNSGTLAKTGGTGTSYIGDVVNSTGSINVATGALQFIDGGSVSGTLFGAGTLHLATGIYTTTGLAGAGNLAIDNARELGYGTLTASATSTITASVHIDGGGALGANAGKILTLTGPLSIDTVESAPSVDGGNLVGAGTVTTTGATTIGDVANGAQALGIAGGITWINAATGVVNDSGLGNSVGGTVVNNGIFNLATDDATITNNGAPNLFTNSGTLAKTGGTGTSYIGDVVNSTGSINVATGALQFIDGGSVSGTLFGAGTLHLATGIYTTTGLAGAGNLAIDNARELGYGTLTASATSTITASVHIDGGGALGANAGKILTLTGPLSIDTVESAPSVDGGNLVGAGTVTTTGATIIGDVARGAQALGIAGGITWINASTCQRRRASGRHRRHHRQCRNLRSDQRSCRDHQ